MQRLMSLVLAAGTCLALAAPALARPLPGFTLEYETGPVFLGQNDGKYGANGTSYGSSLTSQNRNLFLAERLQAEVAWGRHALRLLYAPLDLTTRIRLDAPFTFRDTTFAAGSVLDSRYQFEGYRASYLYRVVEDPSWDVDLGVTAQIRNAVVAFGTVSGTQYADERDIGFVPALKLRSRYTADNGSWAQLEADGLTAVGLSSFQGGILDAAVSLGMPVLPNVDSVLRLRYLWGGATVPSRQITNWGQFTGATAGLAWHL